MTEKRVNKYPGPCGVCGARVPAKGGLLGKKGGAWYAVHLACEGGTPGVIDIQKTTPRFAVLVLGQEVSTHATEAAAIRAATEIASGIESDGAYCGDDGWPTIVDRRDPDRRIDYPTT